MPKLFYRRTLYNQSSNTHEQLFLIKKVRKLLKKHHCNNQPAMHHINKNYYLTF